MKIRPKNWKDFQHYKDRNPTWIKLHKKLLDDYEFQRLPLASRALAPMLWLLASENIEGVIDADPEKLAFRLRWNVAEIADSLSPLIQSAFFEVVQGDSKPLATPERAAIPETERYKPEAETYKPSQQSASPGVAGNAAPPTSPRAFPPVDDPQVTAYTGLCIGSRVSEARALHAQQWIAEGLTEPQLREAIAIAQSKKPPGSSIPVKFLQLMIGDVRAGLTGARHLSAEEVRAQAIANINAKEARSAAH